MTEYKATIRWQRGTDEIFTDRRYSRAHQWLFDGGLQIPASPSPHIVPLPYSAAENIDPEEAFIAALSSCHMLFFLSLAAERGWRIDLYQDEATGILAHNADGRLAMTEVTLKPHIVFIGEQQPSHSDIEDLHHLAHEKCFIANSVKTEIRILMQN